MSSLKNVRHVVLVLSGKGGVGKSSITTQLALSLSLQGQTVGVLDVDLTGPSIPRFFGIEDAKIVQSPDGWQPVRVHEKQILQPVPLVTYPLPAPTSTSNGTAQTTTSNPDATSNGATAPETTTLQHNGTSQPGLNTESTSAPPPVPSSNESTSVGSLYAMSLAFLMTSRSAAVVWRGPKKTAMIRQFLSDVAWPSLDYLLIDTPPGTSDEHISLVETLLRDIGAPTEIHPAQATDEKDRVTVLAAATGDAAFSSSSASHRGPILSGAVIVTTPQAVAVSDVRKELNFCAKTGVRVLGVVENMSGYVCPCCGEASNIFSKGGGQIMAGEFGVPFLGSVPVDPMWGLLVEEGKRPRYDEEVAKDAAREGEESEEDDEAEVVVGTNGEGRRAPQIIMGADMDGVREQGREEGLLVDKYRNCSLYSTFQAIASQVTHRAETGTAVVVQKV